MRWKVGREVPGLCPGLQAEELELPTKPGREPGLSAPVAYHGWWKSSSTDKSQIWPDGFEFFNVLYHSIKIFRTIFCNKLNSVNIFLQQTARTFFQYEKFYGI